MLVCVAIGLLLDSGLNGTLPVPGHSPVAPKAEDAGAPKSTVVAPNGELVVAAPNGLDEVDVFDAPKPVFCPNNPPLVLDAPNGEDAVAGAVVPNPPKPPVDPAVAVPPPNKLPPVVVVVLPNPPGLAPNAVFCECRNLLVLKLVNLILWFRFEVLDSLLVSEGDP